jgi:hypothetical protein
MTSSQHVYEIRPRKDHRGVDLTSDALPFGRLWYGEPNAVSYAKFYSRSIILSRVSHSVSYPALAELPGTSFPVYVSDGTEERARQIAERCRSARHFLGVTFGF